MNWIDWMWLILTFVCIILELLTTGIFFVLFAVGTMAAFVYARLSPSVTGQVITFAVVTLLCLLFLRPFVRRWLHLGKYGKDHTVPDYIEQNIGKEGVVVQPIESEGTGQIKIGSEVWTARMASGGRASVDDRVRVVRIQGVTAYVEALAATSSSFKPKSGEPDGTVDRK
ncbi:NfeD family protein [Alicyclobacillus dauci]|uniref:NfeD family protein n=1 Tax=Alicyclobacillus dauci TaxID=1475485 RepID=A0ABY6Z566_9BACL|nr:NfeD family protein [Alicyclobacillus dauci]WAH37885.1 NfeD family protein [Alicyclobacillus dauci]